MRTVLVVQVKDIVDALIVLFIVAVFGWMLFERWRINRRRR